jgi:hypothetical protein
LGSSVIPFAKKERGSRSGGAFQCGNGATLYYWFKFNIKKEMENYFPESEPTGFEVGAANTSVEPLYVKD